jgi:hypothetical protein
MHAMSGELGAAAALVAEMRAVSDATGVATAPYGALWLLALRGREREALQRMETTEREAVARGEGFALFVGEWVSAVLYNGLGRHDAALAAAGRTAARRSGVAGAGTGRAARGGREVRAGSAWAGGP